MYQSNLCRVIAKASIALCLAMLSAPPVEATIVIDVNIRDPAAVTFTSTGANATANLGGLVANGLTIIDFFSGNTVTRFNGVDAGSLGVLNQAAANGTRDNLDTVFIDTFNPGGWTPDDINFTANSPTGILYQGRTDAPLVTGQITLDLTGFTLPALGKIGDVILETPDAPDLVGQYRVVSVPEPTAFFSLGTISALLSLRRRRTG